MKLNRKKSYLAIHPVNHVVHDQFWDSERQTWSYFNKYTGKDWIPISVTFRDFVHFVSVWGLTIIEIEP